MFHKTILLTSAAVCALAITPLALATTIGPYIGIGGGRAQVNTPSKPVFAAPAHNSRSHNKWGERAFGGFNFTPFFGLEAGYAVYPRTQYVGRLGAGYSSITYFEHATDLVAKLYLPLGGSGFNVYVLGGAARVIQTTQFDNTPGFTVNDHLATPGPGTTHTRRIRPIYGFGANFTFSRHFTVGAEITQIRRLNNIKTNPQAIPDLNLGTINFSYTFC